MAQFATAAERLRHHRRCFELALERGITPKEAEAEIERVAARERDRAATARLEAKIAGSIPAPFQHWDAPWMARD